MRKYCIYILWVISLFFDFKLYAQSIDTIYLKGKEQFEIGNYVKALDYFNQTIKMKKTYKTVNYMAGMTEYNLKNYSSAKKYFKREIKNDPENINAFLFKAKSKENNGKYKSALRDLKKAIKIDSVNVLVLLEKSNILFNQKKYTKAIQSYLQVKRLSPKTELVFYKLGFCEYYLNNTSEACNYWSLLEDIDDFENYETIIKTCKLTH